MTVQKMDPNTAFVHHFCNQVAKMAKGYTDMRAWYLFADKRPGSPVERFEADAKNYAEYMRLFQP